MKAFQTAPAKSTWLGFVKYTPAAVVMAVAVCAGATGLEPDAVAVEVAPDQNTPPLDPATQAALEGILGDDGVIELSPEQYERLRDSAEDFYPSRPPESGYGGNFRWEGEVDGLNGNRMPYVFSPEDGEAHLTLHQFGRAELNLGYADGSDEDYVGLQWRIRPE